MNSKNTLGSVHSRADTCPVCTVVVAHEVSPAIKIILPSLTWRTICQAAWKPFPRKRQCVHQSTKGKFKHCLTPDCLQTARMSQFLSSTHVGWCLHRAPITKIPFPSSFFNHFLFTEFVCIYKDLRNATLWGSFLMSTPWSGCTHTFVFHATWSLLRTCISLHL